MKKTIKQAFRKVLATITKHFAPYFVLNKDTEGKHFAWTSKDAIEWAKMYDSQTFGIVHIRNTYTGKVSRFYVM